jgi:pantoate--beta-alanine ligase
MPSPRLVTTRVEVRSAILDARAAGRKVGLVPTMGALHEGHLSLVWESRKQCDFTVVTIFVNPTQFGPSEDFNRYPRTLEADLRLLKGVQADLVFAPAVEEMYPPGCTTAIEPPEVAKALDGDFRPGHFRGVATIVLKLFNVAPADVAYFGQKDYQQTLVVRRMVEDLNVPIQVQVCPTVREADGLAMSSRNVYLSSEERQRALAVSRALQAAEEMIAGGETDPAAVEARMSQILRDGGVDRIDYAAIVDPETLQGVGAIHDKVAALVAAHVGKTRLIDNRLIG